VRHSAVTDAFTPATYMRKAATALSAARLLLRAGDTDGACNRAYFAMFDAAHAALLMAGIELPEAPVKTHNGLIALFGQHLVRTGHLDAEHGIAFNKVQNLRLLADYEGGPISIENAAGLRQPSGVRWRPRESPRRRDPLTANSTEVASARCGRGAVWGAPVSARGEATRRPGARRRATNTIA